MSGRLKQFLVAAVASALAAVFVVAVGPGFSEPNDSANENAVSATATAEDETTEVSTTEDNSSYVPDPDTEPGGGDDNPDNASTAEDSHGHIGSGTGTSTGSQADPGHKEEGDPGYKAEDGASNGPGTGDEDAASCPNDKSSVNDDVDNGTPNGANYSGPYDSTCDGTNSENGQGSAAPGKGTPCAGCVGNADDKQPGGQVKEFEGDKANDMGYECDGNQGVGAHYGRGNPAHTGDCAPAPPACPSDSEKNAGMPIPEGETEESYCNEDEPPCPTDMQPNVPGLQCEPAPFKAYVCVPQGNSGNFKLEEANSPEEYAELIADGAVPLPGTGVCEQPPCPTDMQPNVPGLQCEPAGFEKWVCVPNGQSGNFREVKADSQAEYDALKAAGAVDLPASGVCEAPPCPVDMQPNVPGLQCEAPPCPTDMQPNVPGLQCEPAGFERYVCVPSGNSGNFHIKKADSQAEYDQLKANGAVDLPASGVCQNTGGKVTICHMTGSITNPFVIISVSPNALITGHDDDHGDINPVDISLCVPTTPPPCPTDMNPFQPGLQCTPPPTCPSNSPNFPGQVPPGGDMTQCNTSNPPCPTDMNPFQPGLQCAPPEVCPANTDLAGQVPPGGDMANCDESVKGNPPTNNEDKVCPAGTDMAGEPVPPGGVRNCNDEVLGEPPLGNPEPNTGGPGDKGDVLGNRDSNERAPLGGVLPFTGTSILAYVIVALQLIGAGVLIMRGRKAKR